MLFNLFNKKCKTKEKVKVGDIRSINDSPFLDTLAVIIVREIRGGWVLYSFCDYINGEFKARPLDMSSHSGECSTILRVYSNLLNKE